MIASKVHPKTDEEEWYRGNEDIMRFRLFKLTRRRERFFVGKICYKLKGVFQNEKNQHYRHYTKEIGSKP